jgi:hypothetical protein
MLAKKINAKLRGSPGDERTHESISGHHFSPESCFSSTCASYELVEGGFFILNSQSYIIEWNSTIRWNGVVVIMAVLV